MIKSTVLHNNTCLRWLSAHLLIGLVFLSSFLALRFGNTHLAKDASSTGDVMQVFFAGQPDFVLLENITAADVWTRPTADIEPLLCNLILFSRNAKNSQQHLYQLNKSYLNSSLFISPGLLLTEIIYPFHSHW